MSFILDALKKSELERQRQSIPGLMDSGTPGVRPRFPLWAIALVALFGINLIALLVVLMRGGAPPASDVHAPAASAKSAMNSPASDRAATEPASASEAAERFSPLDPAPVPVYAPEIPAVDPAVSGSAGGGTAAGASAPAAGSAHQSSAIHPPAGSGGASDHAARRRDPLLTDQDYKAEEEVLPSISELSLSGPQALPELHLDVHVFATKPSERFVYINMRKYREGATLQEGPLLERIRRDGVVLNFQGVRFVLPRQQ